MSALGQKRTQWHVLASPGWQITIDLTADANEDNAVPGRIAPVPFDLGIGDCNTLSVLDVRAAEWFVVACIGDYGDVLIAVDFIAVRPISVCQPTAADARIVWSHQLIEPLAM